MGDFWARVMDMSGQPGPDYWSYFAQRLVDHTTIQPDGMILDIGTFDGNVLFKAMDTMAAGVCGVGVDIDGDGFPAVIVESKQRGLEQRMAFAQMDAHTLGFANSSFHTVVANFVGWDDCFDFDRLEIIRPDGMPSEILRVLKPGGQVGIGSWVQQGDIDWIMAAFERYLPEYDKTTACYGIEHPEGLQRMLHSSGFQDVCTHTETADFLSPDAGTWWRQMRQVAAACYKQAASPGRLEILRKRIFNDLNAHRSPEGIRFSKTVTFATGVKPT